MLIRNRHIAPMRKALARERVWRGAHENMEGKCWRWNFTSAIKYLSFAGAERIFNIFFSFLFFFQHSLFSNFRFFIEYFHIFFIICFDSIRSIFFTLRSLIALLLNSLRARDTHKTLRAGEFFSIVRIWKMQESRGITTFKINTSSTLRFCLRDASTRLGRRSSRNSRPRSWGGKEQRLERRVGEKKSSQDNYELPEVLQDLCYKRRKKKEF